MVGVEHPDGPGAQALHQAERAEEARVVVRRTRAAVVEAADAPPARRSAIAHGRPRFGSHGIRLRRTPHWCKLAVRGNISFASLSGDAEEFTPVSPAHDQKSKKSARADLVRE